MATARQRGPTDQSILLRVLLDPASKGICVQSFVVRLLPDLDALRGIHCDPRGENRLFSLELWDVSDIEADHLLPRLLKASLVGVPTSEGSGILRRVLMTCAWHFVLHRRSEKERAVLGTGL